MELAMKRLLIFTNDEAVSPLLSALSERDVQVLCVSRGPIYCGYDNITILQSVDPGITQAAVQSFHHEVVIHFLKHSTKTLSADELKLIVTCGTASMLLSEFVRNAILTQVRNVSVKLHENDHEVCSVNVDVSVETALSLRFKIEQAGLSLLLENLPKRFGLRQPALNIKSEEISDSDAERQIRALFDPPYSLGRTSCEDKDFYVESYSDWRKVKKIHSASATSTRPNSAFFSNVGGSIVKISERDPMEGLVQISQKPRNNFRKLRMNEPLIGPNAHRYVSETLDSRWLGVEGRFVKKLEKKFAELAGVAGGVAVNSGTAALYGALKGLGVSHKSHFVICPAYTCAACADAVVQAGGTPIICDVELESFALSADSVSQALQKYNVFAVIVAPCYGVPARDLLRISEICKSRGIFLIEDNCESYGATFAGGKSVGSVGDVSVVSIRSEKMVGVGEGGLILSDNLEILQNARWWCSRAPTRGVGLWQVYKHDEVGMNYRLPELLAAVGVAALESLPVMISRKRAIHEWYKEAFANSRFKLQLHAEDDDPVWWINSVVLPDDLRAETIGSLLMVKHPEIEIRPGFFPLQRMKPFESCCLPCPNAVELYDRVICLPSSAMLTQSDIKHICKAFSACVDDVIQSDLLLN